MLPQRPHPHSAPTPSPTTAWKSRDFTLRQVRVGDASPLRSGKRRLSAPVPPIRESKYLDKQQSIEIYRWMLLNRRMETALENLYKQGKVVGGVYFGLGQEACSCASAYALKPDDWLGPMIRNQGSLLVRGFSAARHHDAVHGQGRLADQRPRRLLALRRLSESQRRRADLDSRRSDPRARRRCARRASARDATSP